MKLQISLDVIDLDKALEIAAQVADSCDILEIGSLLIYKYGLQAMEQFKKAFPSKTLLADVKIVDRGKEIVSLLGQAGADWITVMAGTDKNVVHTACTEAEKNNMKVMLDLLDAASKGQSAMEAKNLGANALLFHQAYDAQEPQTFLDKWDMVKGNSSLPIFISAHIKRENVEEILKLNPAGLIIGKSITGAANPKEEAEYFYQLVKNK